MIMETNEDQPAGLQTPPRDHAAVHAIVAGIGPGSVAEEIPWGPAGPRGNCYWNVAHACAKFGGYPVHGWMLQWLPGKLVAAVHHAAWFNPKANRLVDPTAKDTADQTLFVRDLAITVGLEYPSYVAPKFHVIDPQDQDVQALISGWTMAVEAKRELARRLFERGYRFDHLMKRAADPNVTPGDPKPFMLEEDVPLLMQLRQGRTMQGDAMRHLAPRGVNPSQRET